MCASILRNHHVIPPLTHRLISPQCSGFSTKQPPGHPKARNSQEDAMVKVSKNSRVLLDNPFRKLQDVQASRPLISRPMPLSVRTTHQNNKPISRKELPQVSLRPSLPKCSSANSTIRGASSTPMLHQYNPECSLKPIPRRSSIGHVLASSPSEAVDGDVDTRRIAATRAHSQEKLKPIRIRYASQHSAPI